MKNDDDFINEVYHRAAAISKKRQKRRSVIAISASLAAVIGLLTSLSYILSSLKMDENPVFDTGLGQASIFAQSSMGGYVIIGVVSFVFGVLFAWFFRKKKFTQKT